MDKKTLESRSFLTILFITTAAFVWLVRGYLEPVFWAAVIAVIFRPLHVRWLALTRRPNLAAALSLLTVVVAILLPLFLVGLAVSNESIGLYGRIKSGELDPIRWLQAIPIPDQLLERLSISRAQIMERLSGFAVAATQYLGTRVFAIGQGALHLLVSLGIMLYLLFFFFRDGDTLVERLIRTFPLGDRRERRLYSNFATVSRATLKGSFVVGIVQGSLGGLLFAFAGISGAVFWGTLMTLCSLIPAVGTAAVWLPAGIILLAGGNTWQGILVLAGGAFVITLIDNLLRPMLVGKTTQLPNAMIFLSTLGGLSVFGLAGIVAGPIIASFFVAVWEMFETEYGDEG